VIRDRTSKKNTRSTCNPYMDKDVLRASLKNPLQKSWRIVQYEQKPAKNSDRVANRTLSIKRTFKLELVKNPGCDQRKQASGMVSNILCDCEALATLRFRHLVHH